MYNQGYDANDEDEDNESVLKTATKKKPTSNRLNITADQFENLKKLHETKNKKLSVSIANPAEIVVELASAKEKENAMPCDADGQNQSFLTKEWKDYEKQEKISFIGFAIVKIVLFILLLYLFLLSLNFMTIGFTMISGYAIKAGDTIRFLLANPFAALAIGVIVTAIMQNATATTSIAVSMVGAGIIPDVQSAIPIIMGANIGTCVTNSLIALTLSGDPNEFKRAFSAATLNDMFNFLTTGILLPIEIFTSFLFVVSTKLTNLMPFDNIDAIAKANFMAGILNPVCNLFILLDNDVVNAVANGAPLTQVALRCCESIVVQLSSNETLVLNEFMNQSNTTIQNVTVCVRECTYWCMPMLHAFGDGGTGVFWIVLSIVTLIACLFGIVKVLSLLIVGPIAKAVNIAINASIPGKMRWFTQVILFLIAFFLTLIVQSSNIITATLVPLCGIGIVTLQRVYVMTLGSNIGTTVTAILTAFTGPAASLKKSMQLAFAYTLFNSLGVLFWLPLPWLRFPKRLARALGNVVFKYRWFLYCYVISVYFILPLIVFGLALIPYYIGLAVFGIPFILLVATIVTVKCLSSSCPNVLPARLKDTSWLPIWMRSLQPFEKKINSLPCCAKKDADSISQKPSLIDDQLGEEEMPAEPPTHGMSLSYFIRRLSGIDSLATEALRLPAVKRNSIISENSSSEEEHDCKEVIEYRRRKSRMSHSSSTIRRASTLSNGNYKNMINMTKTKNETECKNEAESDSVTRF